MIAVQEVRDSNSLGRTTFNFLPFLKAHRIPKFYLLFIFGNSMKSFYPSFKSWQILEFPSLLKARFALYTVLSTAYLQAWKYTLGCVLLRLL